MAHELTWSEGLTRSSQFLRVWWRKNARSCGQHTGLPLWIPCILHVFLYWLFIMAVDKRWHRYVKLEVPHFAIFTLSMFSNSSMRLKSINELPKVQRLLFSLVPLFRSMCWNTHIWESDQVGDNSPSQVSDLPSEITLLLLYAPFQTCACTTQRPEAKDKSFCRRL